MFKRARNYYNQNIGFKFCIIVTSFIHIGILAYIIYYYYLFQILINRFPSNQVLFLRKIINVCWYRMLGYVIFPVEGLLLLLFFWLVPLGVIFERFEFWLYENLSYSEVMYEKDERYLKKYLEHISTKKILVFLTLSIPGIYLFNASLPFEFFVMYFNILILIASFFIFNVDIKIMNDLKFIDDTRIPKVKDKFILGLFINFLSFFGFFFILPYYSKFLMNMSYKIYLGNFQTTIQNIVNIYRITDPSSIPQNFITTDLVKIFTRTVILLNKDLSKLSSLFYMILGVPAILWVVYSSFLSGIKRVFISGVFFIIGASIPRIISFSIYGGTFDMILFGYVLSGFGTFGTSIIKALTRKWTLVECTNCGNFVEKEYGYCPYCGEKF